VSRKKLALSHFNMQYSPRVVADLKAAGIDVYGDTRLIFGNYYYRSAIETGSYEALGQGLHAIQDIFAHGNTGIKGIDQEGFDALLAGENIASHKFRPGAERIDNQKYDWADCTLTKTRDTDTGSRERYYSTELASKAYVASGYYEMQHR